MIKTIKDKILERLGVKLSGFSKMSFSYSIEENKFNKNKKTYGVNSGSFQTTEGASCLNTLDHKFDIVLTDTFLSGGGSQLNDDLKAEKVVELQDKCLMIYKDLQVNKNVLGAGILIVNGLSVSTPEFLEEENIVVLRMSVNIKYKN